jgi:hypothetical protein
MLSILSILLSISCQLIAAPATPITRGRLTTDLDAAGHSITNSPMATTNFVWDVVGSVTNNLPSGGIDEETVRSIITPVEDLAIQAKYTAEHAEGTAEINRQAISDLSTVAYTGDYADLSGKPDFSGIPVLPESATIGDFVDVLRAVLEALP